MSHKNHPVYKCRLSANISAQMNARLDTLAEMRNQPKSELAREAIRFWLDHQEDARMSRQFFTRSFQRRLDHVDWQLELVLQFLLALSGKKPDLLQRIIRAAHESDLTDLLQTEGLRRAGRNRKPPAK